MACENLYTICTLYPLYLDELHEHVDAVVVLEGGQQLQHKHVAAVSQNVLFFHIGRDRGGGKISVSSGCIGAEPILCHKLRKI